MDVEEIVKECRAKFKPAYERKLDQELYPAAFANEYSWQRVQNALQAHDEFTRKYVVAAIQKVFEDSKANG
jgi:hypothetical protein